MSTTISMYNRDWEIDGVAALFQKLAESAEPGWDARYEVPTQELPDRDDEDAPPVVRNADAVGSIHLKHPDYGQITIGPDALGPAIETIFRDAEGKIALLFFENTSYREIINFVHTGHCDEITEVETLGELLEALTQAANIQYWLFDPKKEKDHA